MILFFEWGRLGNQLFQYCAMRTYAPQARIVAFGMDDLRRHFTGVDLAPRRSINRVGLVARLVYHLIEAGTRLRLVGSVDEEPTEDGPRFRVRRGLIPGLIVFRGLWQAEAIADGAAGRVIDLAPAVRARADATLAALPGTPGDRYFVHVRRGDYTRFPTPEHPAVLPLAWYLARMEAIRARHPGAVFVVTTDDLPYAEEFLAGRPGVTVVAGSPIEDFAVMAGCLGGGVLSASSYSWWAAWFVHRRSAQATFVAPRHWYGHGAGAWDPPGIRTGWIEYVDAATPRRATPGP